MCYTQFRMSQMLSDNSNLFTKQDKPSAYNNDSEEKNE